MEVDWGTGTGWTSGDPPVDKGDIPDVVPRVDRGIHCYRYPGWLAAVDFVVWLRDQFAPLSQRPPLSIWKRVTTKSDWRKISNHLRASKISRSSLQKKTAVRRPRNDARWQSPALQYNVRYVACLLKYNLLCQALTIRSHTFRSTKRTPPSNVPPKTTSRDVLLLYTQTCTKQATTVLLVEQH